MSRIEDVDSGLGSSPQGDGPVLEGGGTRSARAKVLIALTLFVGLCLVGFLRPSLFASAEPWRAGLFEASHRTGFVAGQLDVGRHAWRSEVPVRLDFANSGVQEVVLTKFESECECIQFSVKPDGVLRVPPGTVVSIRAGLSTEAKTGRLSRLVRVTDQSGARYECRIEFEVVGTYQLVPPAVDLGDLLCNSSVISRNVGFTSEMGVKLIEASSDVEWLSVELNKFGLRVLADSTQLKPGPHVGRITVRTDDPRRPGHSLPVYLRVTSDTGDP